MEDDKVPVITVMNEEYSAACPAFAGQVRVVTAVLQGAVGGTDLQHSYLVI